MTDILLAGLGFIVVLLIFSGFLSGSETALTAVSRARMHQLEKDGSRAAHDVNALLSDREDMLGAILLGNTFTNILASSLATALLAARFGDRAIAITTVVMTFVVLVFAEILPKTLAIARTDRFALTVARVLLPVVRVLAPVVDSVQFIVWHVLGVFGVREEANPVPMLPPHEEIRGTVELHHKEGTVEREHRDMIGGILDLYELQVGDVMVHRKNMATVDAGEPAANLFESFIAANHARVPVWRDSPDNIVGILQTQTVMREFVRRKGQLQGFDILALLEEAWFVPDTTSLEEQLGAFRKRRSHFALVVDEYGTLQGLITLTDIFEEIFGHISEEPETRAGPKFRPQADGSYLIDGVTPVRDLNRELEWNLPDEEATTVAGLVIHEARTIPDVGQRFAFYGFKFEILRRSRNQITLLRVTPPPSQTSHATGT
ncbi:MAG: HlyC/CorC family transporter [Rhizomicrobium sp.]|jgi:Mg2+/Co2+ transporter CorB